VTAEVGLKEASSFFEKLGVDFPAAAKRGLVSAANEGLQVILTQIIPSRSPVPNDMGLYRTGWKVDSSEPADGATIYNDEPHAVFIEEGVRSGNVRIGRAMLDALSAWAVRKGLAEAGEDALEVAWAIARAAQSRGFFEMTGLGVLRELVEQHLPGLIERNVADELRRVVR
jgi:hypothetical protein